MCVFFFLVFVQVAGGITQVLAGRGQRSANGQGGWTSPLWLAPGWLFLLRTLSKTLSELGHMDLVFTHTDQPQWLQNNVVVGNPEYFCEPSCFCLDV